MLKPWKTLFKPYILERGEDYFLVNRVRELERTDEGWSAIVEGSENYEVEIYLDGDEVDGMYCDCPYAKEDNNCKHMAAVLYAIETGGSETAVQWPLSPEELAELIPESRLRPLLAELMSDDSELYHKLMLQYGNISTADGMKVLEQDFDEICGRYLGESGYVNYRESYYFAEETAAFIQAQTDYLLEMEEPLTALNKALSVLQSFSSCDSDDSDGGYGLVVSAVRDTYELVLERCGEDELDKVFDSLSGLLERPGTHWFVRELVQEIIFPDSEVSEFENIRFLRKKLGLLDSQIAALEGKQRGGESFSEYEMEWLLKCRFKMMEKLSFLEAECSAFLDKYIRFPDIRILRVELYLKTGDTDATVRLLREGKLVDGDKSGLVKDYSRKLIELYRRTGRKDELLFELEYMVFELRGDMDDLHALKGNAPRRSGWNTGNAISRDAGITVWGSWQRRGFGHGCWRL